MALSELTSNLNAETVSFRVSPERLNERAVFLMTAIRKLRAEFQDAAEAVLSSENIWRGEAADAYREEYCSADDSAQEILQELAAYVSRLNAIAGNYSAVEAAVRGDFNTALPDQVIV